jgi:hypothetical protein
MPHYGSPKRAPRPCGIEQPVVQEGHQERSLVLVPNVGLSELGSDDRVGDRLTVLRPSSDQGLPVLRPPASAACSCSRAACAARPSACARRSRSRTRTSPRGSAPSNPPCTWRLRLTQLGRERLGLGHRRGNGVLVPTLDQVLGPQPRTSRRVRRDPHGSAGRFRSATVTRARTHNRPSSSVMSARYGTPDEETLNTGDSGPRIACGVVR